MMKGRLIIVFALLLLSSLAFASEAAQGAAHEAGIPFSVTLQAINFAIYAGILFYFLKNPVREYFRGRETNYKQALVKAEHAKTEAEKKKREIHHRMTQLEGNSKDSVDKARSEALALVQQIEQQGKEMSERLRQEAARTASLEVERARTSLRHDMLTEAVALSRKLLTDKMAEPDQRRLQTEFVDKIREVQA